MDFDTAKLNAEAQVLVQAVLDRFPDWHRWARPYGEGDPEAEPGSVSFEIPSPAHDARHTLRIVLRRTSVEVHYDDARPPGPAEKLFVFDAGEERMAFEAVLDFATDIVHERVVVGRERLSKFSQLLRGRDCVDLPRFFRPQDLTDRTRRKLTSVFSWRGTCV